MNDVLNLNNKKENSNPIDALREEVIKNAENMLNRKPRPNYKWGGTGPDKYDCSGFTQKVYKDSGIGIHKYSGDQGSYAKLDKNKSNLKPGDLIFFETDSDKPNTISHVGIYKGPNGEFIDCGGGGKRGVRYPANHPRNGVRISNLNDSYWKKTFMGGISLEKIVEKTKNNVKGKGTIKKELDNAEKTVSAPQKTTVNNEKRLEKCLDYIFQVEGGYSNHPNDKGGPTKYGITQSVARNNGYTGNMKEFPKDKAKEIYAKDYYYKNKIDKIADDRVALSVFDWVVNSGGSKKEIQKMLNKEYGFNLATDGVIGEKTLSALNSVDSDSLLKNISTTQRNYYDYLVRKEPKYESFHDGWHNRVDRKENYIQKNFSKESTKGLAEKISSALKDDAKTNQKAAQNVKKSGNVR